MLTLFIFCSEYVLLKSDKLSKIYENKEYNRIREELHKRKHIRKKMTTSAIRSFAETTVFIAITLFCLAYLLCFN